MKTWNKIKTWAKENPDEAIFYGATTAASALLVTAYVYIVKANSDAIKAYEEEQEKQENWLQEERNKGHMVLALADGSLMSFDPTKPLYGPRD